MVERPRPGGPAASGAGGGAVRGAGDTTWLRVRHSVFAKLVATMLVMAASLLLLVSGFFWFIISPTFTTTIDRVLDDQARTVAATAPGLDEAKRVGARLGCAVRYEGPAGQWSTSEDLPSVEDVRQRRVSGWSRLVRGRHYYVVNAPDGGTYLFAWKVPRAMQEAHTALLILLLVIMTAVVLTAHSVLNRLLRPLRGLSDAVARLGAGDLDVALAHPTRDEFGRLTDAFNAMVGRVREMITSREQLLIDVSHELRSPLTRLKVALQLLPASSSRAGIEADVDEMERMIAELLELERLRGGRTLDRVRQDLAPIVRDVAAPFQLTQPGVQVHLLSPELPVAVDSDKIRTVLRNLLENASKYALPDSQPIDISARQIGDRVEVRVTDDGPGIPERDLPSLFEPFFRVDRSRSKKTGGYGLGLAISKRIVEAHGGTIAAENNPTRGASFVLTFPTSASPN